MTLSTLRQFYEAHKDKASDKWQSYLDAYEEVLSPYRNRPIRILEIGVQNGGSLEIWAKYFPEAKLIAGCDVDEACRHLRYDNPRIKVVIGNANSDAVQAEILDLSKQFDIIIDDGSHRSGDIVASFARYFPYLEDGGIYIAEDLHCSYWKTFQGGLFDPHASMSFFKRLADILNFEHWRVDGDRADLLRSFAKVYGCSFSGAELARIGSVDFRNSLCLIRKRPARCTSLGPRVVAGTETRVASHVLALNGVAVAAVHELSERDNEWSRIELLPEVELTQLKEVNSALNTQDAALRSQIEALTREIGDLSQRLKQEHAELELSRRVLRQAEATKSLVENTLNERLRATQAKVDQESNAARHYQQLAEATLSSTSWRITAPLRRLSSSLRRQREVAGVFWRAARPSGNDDRKRIKGAIARRLGSVPSAAVEREDAAVATNRYAEWISKFDVLNRVDRTLILRHSQEVALSQLLVIWLLPANAKAETILEAVTSLARQLCGNWRAILVQEQTIQRSQELEKLLHTTPNIAIVSQASEAGAAVSAGMPCLLISGAGQLAEHATYMFGVEAQRTTAAIYCDEDDLVGDERYSPRFAPAFSPELPAAGSLVLLRGSSHLVAALARATQEPLNLSDLLLREALAVNSEPHHIPFILFHARSTQISKSEVSPMWLEGREGLPKIAIIIPTRNRLDFLEPCVRSILDRTDYPRERYEIVIVDNGSTDEDILRFLDQMGRAGDLTVLRDPQKFNYARLNNHAAARTQSDLLAFVNNDVVVIDPLWLRRLAFYASKRGVGAVGAKLLYPDRTVQHGGVVLGIQGVAAHAHHNLEAEAPGYLGLSNTTHAISAVTGACLVVKRSAFDEVGGFDERLAVAFNDVLLCIALSEHGYRNIYVGHALMIHFESKTRGFDDTEEKQQLFRREARYARRTYPAPFKDDPYYNSNLSLEKTYELAFPPRVEKPWQRFRRESTGKLRILMLSSTHQIGHGVAVVVDQQARYLADNGHTIFVGGPLAKNEFPYPGCHRVYLDGPQEAAIFAAQHAVDCVVMHTPPFYSTTRWLGPGVRTLAYDYGEPNPDFFPDASARRTQLQEKDFCLEMADGLYAISEAVKAESSHERMGVIPLGNSHLAQWSEPMANRRAAKRVELGLADSIVVLNVCRFHEGERHYKGVDEYCRVKDLVEAIYPERSSGFVFILAGKGNEADVIEMEAAGLRVFANVSDEELIDLYCCADVYVNFSRWEGYNLGIGQALAFGLPVVASDIPAHRAFGVFVSNESASAVQELIRLSAQKDQTRIPKIAEWTEPLRAFLDAILKLNFRD